MDHSVYFDGAVQSLSFRAADSKISVGVLSPGQYSFTTDAAEHVEILTGSVEISLSSGSRRVVAGGSYDVPPAVQFQLVCHEHVSYVCCFRHVAVPEHVSLDAPAILERTPALIAAIVDGVDARALEWQPNTERWSTRMTIAHLADSEVNCFRARLRQVALAADCTVLGPYDQWAIFRNGELPSAHESLRTLARERQTTLEFLRGLDATVLTRKCRHHTLGTLTFDDLLNEFAFHDMGHMRQILELCRARVYYPRMGVWRNFYQVNP